MSHALVYRGRVFFTWRGSAGRFVYGNGTRSSRFGIVGKYARIDAEAYRALDGRRAAAGSFNGTLCAHFRVGVVAIVRGG
jgi:hypothetical protein